MSPLLVGPVSVDAFGTHFSETTRAVLPTYFEVAGIRVADGEALTSDDEAGLRRVCVLGASTAQAAFPGGAAPGRRLTLSGSPFVVKGIAAVRGPDSAGRSQDNFILVPFSTGRTRLFNVEGIRLIIYQVRDARDVNRLSDAIAERLRARHGIPLGLPDDFIIQTPKSLLEHYRRLFRTGLRLGWALTWLFAALSGAILMAVMITATQRLRVEISLKRALGASKRDIIFEFLARAASLGAAGAVTGTLLAFFSLPAVHRIVNTADGSRPLVVIPVEWNLLLAGAFAALAAAALFGVYPAAVAARLDPAEGLRQMPGH